MSSPHGLPGQPIDREAPHPWWAYQCDRCNVWVDGGHWRIEYSGTQRTHQLLTLCDVCYSALCWLIQQEVQSGRVASAKDAGADALLREGPRPRRGKSDP